MAIRNLEPISIRNVEPILRRLIRNVEPIPRRLIRNLEPILNQNPEPIFWRVVLACCMVC